MKNFNRRARRLTVGLLATVLLMTLIGSGFSRQTLAAGFVHNPIGVINSCRLVGSQTVVYGWAHDPDAPAGADPLVAVGVGGTTTPQTVNAYTTIAGYHDNEINSYLALVRSTGPRSNTYGFTVSFSGLYKGTLNNIYGTAYNYGQGADVPLFIDTTSSNREGIYDSSLFNANQTIPDVCLATAPVAPPPVVTPPPTTNPPTTNPPVTSPPKTTPTNPTSPTQPKTQTQPKAKTTSPGTPSTNGLSAAADATIASGTLGAVATVPSDGATSVYLTYGSSPTDLAKSTETVNVVNGNALVVMSDLLPQTDYYYQIIRADSSGRTSTSTPVGFKTSGYGVTLHFIDKDGKAVSGVIGVINDSDKTTSTSNKSGDMSFANLDTGQYDVTYQYGKLTYKHQFDTANGSDGSDNPGETITLRDIVNVSKLTGGSTKPLDTNGKHHSLWPIILFILLLIAAVVGFVLWRLRRRNDTNPYGSSYVPLTPDIIDKPTPAPAPVPKPLKHAKAEPPAEQLEHVGQSLREMVIQSMHEEAQKRKTNRP